jgi:hypothetical protein
VQLIKLKGLRSVLTLLVVGCFLGGLTPRTPALAQAPAGPQVLMEKPEEGAKPEEKKEEAPTTGGPIYCDSCIPIEAGHASSHGCPLLPLSRCGASVRTA